jgi:2,3-bisphosphoglycerate-dependent phosphoglycerate mutase
MPGKLILARHHESEWNKLGKWTGKRDRHLTDHGFDQSGNMGLLIKGMDIDYAFASMQVRSIETLSCILNICKKYEVKTEHRSELNERDYGIYTGKNKWEMEKLLGEEEYKKLRRSWDYTPEGGESLEMVFNRVVPFFKSTVLPLVQGGKNVLVVAHGNSLRALIKYIERISDGDIADAEFPFGTMLIYDLDDDGHTKGKELRRLEEKHTSAHPQIIATIGPKSKNLETITEMSTHGMGIARLNLSWNKNEDIESYITCIREAEKKSNRKILILADLPGPRVQQSTGHTYIPEELPTERDRELIQISVAHNVDYIALSFVGTKDDVVRCREAIRACGGTQKIVAKIERMLAVDNVDTIIEEADAVMVARGDLGTEVPLEKIPFVQEEIIKKCNQLQKPVIVATQMMLSMKDNPEPTRAEVEDVTQAILEGADAVMLSEETAVGAYPAIAVATMEKIIREAISHMEEKKVHNL